jgi:hypothetical protein
LLDAAMLVKENPDQNFLVGGLDVISNYNYNIDTLAGFYKNAPISNADLYNTHTKGTIAGEGTAMFIVNGLKENAIANIVAVEMCFTKDDSIIKQRLELFLKKHFKEDEHPDILLTGEDGDSRSLNYYNECESLMSEAVTVARFKHLTGDYATATATATWLGLNILQHQGLPAHLIKRKGDLEECKTTFIYNCYRQTQHSFILLKRL